MGLTYALGLDHWNFRFLAPKIRPGMTVYDLGANRGQMALFFSSLVGPSGKVLAFEPVPENVNWLRKNLTLNDMGNVEVFPVAAAADDQPKRFCLDAGRHTMGTLEQNTGNDTWWNQVLEVQCLTLDSLLTSHPSPDFLKIDVEGGGGDVIEGALQLLEKHRPSIYFEIHAGQADSAELVALRLLQDRFHYELTRIDAPGTDPFVPGWGVPIWCQPPMSP
jgi:FkbM family methyltransferase